MKYIIIILMLSPLFSFCQPSGTAFIRISGVGLQQVIRGFMEAGYPIERSDSTLRSIFTRPRKSDHDGVTMILKADIKKDYIIMSGEYAAANSTVFSGIKCTAEKQGPEWNSWQQMLSVADSFKKPVEYGK